MSIDGLPTLPSGVNILEDVAAAILDTFLGAPVSSNTWGLFLDGASVVTADNVVSFEYKEEWHLPTYPIEQGGFGTYNKVQTPFDVVLRFSTGGSPSDRQNFIASVQAIISSLDLYDAVTPEATYSSVNPFHWAYVRKSPEGQGLVMIDLFCQLVNVSAQATFSDTMSPTAAADTPQGLVQAQPYTGPNLGPLQATGGVR